MLKNLRFSQDWFYIPTIIIKFPFEAKIEKKIVGGKKSDTSESSQQEYG